MTNFYCTIIDKNYVLRGLTLYNSFRPHLANKIFGFFCVDNDAVEMLNGLNLTNAWIVKPEEFETDELRAVKPIRAMNEYCWTCKPAVLLYAAERDPSLKWLVYLDSDMMAFGDPDQGLPKQEDLQVCLTPHNPCNQYYSEMMPTVGQCNAGYAAFKNSEVGLAAIQWWLDRCLELCPRVPTENAYADQKYFDHIADHFEGIYFSDHAGLNAGPWNTLEGLVEMNKETVCVNGAPLLLYHFQGFKAYNSSVFDLYSASVKLPDDLRANVFDAYTTEMKRAWQSIAFYYVSKEVRFDKFPYSLRRILSEIKRFMVGKSNFVRLP